MKSEFKGTKAINLELNALSVWRSFTPIYVVKMQQNAPLKLESLSKSFKNVTIFSALVLNDRKF